MDSTCTCCLKILSNYLIYRLIPLENHQRRTVLGCPRRSPILVISALVARGIRAQAPVALRQLDPGLAFLQFGGLLLELGDVRVQSCDLTALPPDRPPPQHAERHDAGDGATARHHHPFPAEFLQDTFQPLVQLLGGLCDSLDFPQQGPAGRLQRLRRRAGSIPQAPDVCRCTA